jgi:hypothetical protein
MANNKRTYRGAQYRANREQADKMAQVMFTMTWKMLAVYHPRSLKFDACKNIASMLAMYWRQPPSLPVPAAILEMARRAREHSDGE